ncbi:MAG: hypothetical protein ACI8Z1_003375 [Candidatus Azotimanducaceae bacterium]|jgi:hypothetical protein
MVKINGTQAAQGWANMIEHNIIAAKNCAFITIKQSPDLGAFLKATRIFIADPEYTPQLHRICDFSQADMSKITAQDFMKFVEFAVSEVKLCPAAKVALVAPSPNKRGIFEQLANTMGAAILRIFSEPEDAMIWIHQSPHEDDLPGPANSKASSNLP